MRRAIVALLAGMLAMPVHAQTVTLDFPVPAVTIHPGEVVSEGHVIDRRLVANAGVIRSFSTSRNQIVGKVAKRVLPAGAAVPLNALREPHVFKDGERVVFGFTIGGLAIRGSGVALEPGVVGRSVRVRNLDTGVVVNGIVQPDGTIELGGG